MIVAAPGRNGEETRRPITESGGSAQYVQADVGSLADMQRAVGEAVEHFGGLDGLVHNATSRESSVVTKLTDLEPAASSKTTSPSRSRARSTAPRPPSRTYASGAADSC